MGVRPPDFRPRAVPGLDVGPVDRAQSREDDVNAIGGRSRAAPLRGADAVRPRA